MALQQEDYEISVSGDKLSAFLTLKNEAIRGQFNLDDLKSALATKRVSYGLDEEKLAAIVAEPVFNVPQQIAAGVAAVEGKDEYITYKFPVGKVELEETESGSIDFRNIDNFNNIEADSVLAEKVVPPEGSDGVNVHGEAIKAKKSRTVAIKVGKGVRVSEDGLQAISEVAGHAALIADRITMSETVEVPAHVDYSIGNISFIGNVRVRGGVMPGFRVEAKGNVEIANNVEQATVICGGNLMIRGMVFGHGDCEIKVGGDAQIGAIDQADVEVHGTLLVQSYITHCNILAGSEVVIDSQKGKLIGGEVRAYRGIRAPFVGNNMATLTRLAVGSNPFISGEIEKLTEQKNASEGKLLQIQNAIKATLAKKSIAPLPESAQAMLDKLRVAEPQLKAMVVEMDRQIEDFREKSADCKDAKIRVSEIIYSGVMISFRDKVQMKTMDETQRVTFYEDAAEIRTGPY